MADFQRNVLDSLMPFRSSDDLAAKFDELFDGFQVLPKSLEAEYERRKEEDELSAPALLVPITRGQFFSIKPIMKEWHIGCRPPVFFARRVGIEQRTSVGRG